MRWLACGCLSAWNVTSGMPIRSAIAKCCTITVFESLLAFQTFGPVPTLDRPLCLCNWLRPMFS
jgi:hypothetical protein